MVGVVDVVNGMDVVGFIGVVDSVETTRFDVSTIGRVGGGVCVD